MAMTDEDQELLQDPSIGPNASFRFTALLTLEVAELLHQVDELLGHGLGPPPRATTTFPLVGSIRRHHPGVKRLDRRQPRVDGACNTFRRGAVVRPLDVSFTGWSLHLAPTPCIAGPQFSLRGHGTVAVRGGDPRSIEQG